MSTYVLHSGLMPISSEQLSAHFTVAEARCKHCRELPLKYLTNAESLAKEVLEPLRGKLWLTEHVEIPLRVVSWYRCPEKNKEVAGAKGSRHLTASAADVVPILPEDNTLPRIAWLYRMASIAVDLPSSVLLYPSHLHVDQRDYPVYLLGQY